MLYNYASIIIINLLFKNIEYHLKKITSARSIAYSPLMDCSLPSTQTHMSITLYTHTKKNSIHLAFTNFSYEEKSEVSAYFKKIIHDINITINVIFKKSISLRLELDHNKIDSMSDYKEINISAVNSDFEKLIQIFFPLFFLKLFSTTITNTTSAESIEHKIVQFFRNPAWMLPDIAQFLNVLSKAELSILINNLQKKGLLTPYQIFLIITAYPELSGLIKAVLSKNYINDVILFNKQARTLKIQKRDIAGGIYSVQESILMLMKQGIDLHYSIVLKHMQTIIQMSLNIDLVLKQRFVSWLSEIESQGLLHETISITNDIAVAYALSRETDECLSIIQKNITVRKMNSLRPLIKRGATVEDIVKARIEFITHYRKLKVGRFDVHPDRFSFVLTSFIHPGDYTYLLLTVGWFILSTALKGIHKKAIIPVLNNIPPFASMLIEDVVKGVVNPNILHDEMQVKKARMQCMKAIFQLYTDGLIDLE